MIGKLSSQGQRGLLILGAATVCLLAFAAAPFFLNASLERDLDESRRELAFLKDKLNNPKTSRNVSLTGTDQVDSMYFSGATEGLAQAAFQALVSSLASANGLQVGRTQPLQSDRRDALQVLKLDIAGQGATASIRDFALAVEQARQFIFVRGASITLGNQQRDPASPFLNFSMRLEAYANAGVTQ